MRGKRQQQILQMVHGYESTFTLAAMVRAVFLVWVLVGFALIVAGFKAYTADALSPSGRDAFRMLDALRSGPVLLFVFTGLLTATWLTRTRMNVKHLGKKAKIGLWKRLTNHVLAAFVGVAVLIAAVLIPPLFRTFFIAGIGLLFYSQLWFHLLMLDAVQMLWRTSSPPVGQEEDVEHYGLIWFWSWVVFSSLFFAEELHTLSPRVVAALSVIEGITCILAAVTAAKLVTGISERQDQRLYAIIGNVDDPDRALAPVTSDQMQAAWDESEGLIHIPH